MATAYTFPRTDTHHHASCRLLPFDEANFDFFLPDIEQQRFQVPGSLAKTANFHDPNAVSCDRLDIRSLLQQLMKP
jgi:hypothetical protein